MVKEAVAAAVLEDLVVVRAQALQLRVRLQVQRHLKPLLVQAHLAVADKLDGAQRRKVDRNRR